MTAEPRAYYNDIDPEAVAVLNELVACGVIAPGDVDGRSIKDVTADDIKGYTQCHFFAGAGLWSVGARLVGWPDWRPLWSASCPCQPLSAAGMQRGADDPRHLWPDLFRLLRAVRAAGQPVPVLVGEQVAGALGYHWFDGVRTDLAREDIAARTIDIPACAVDAPHERNRLWWVAVALADSGGETWRRLRGPGEGAGADRQRPHHQSGGSDGGTMADTESLGGGREQPQRGPQGRAADRIADAEGAVGDTVGAGLEGLGRHGDDGTGRPHPYRSIAPANGRNGTFWSDAEWIACHDGKARRAKPGIPMLVDGMAGRIAVWRLAGNSIVPQLAAEVLAAILDAEAMMT